MTVPTETQFRGVFLTCADVETTAAFYRDIAGLALTAAGDEEYSYQRIDVDGIQIALHDAEAFADYTSPPHPASNLTHLYFRIADRTAFLDRLDAAGIIPVAVDDVVVTVADPDGRKVMFGTA